MVFVRNNGEVGLRGYSDEKNAFFCSGHKGNIGAGRIYNEVVVFRDSSVFEILTVSMPRRRIRLEARWIQISFFPPTRVGLDVRLLLFESAFKCKQNMRYMNKF